MKKIFKLVVGLVVLASVFMLSGCGVLEETYNKWYKYNSQLSLPLADPDADDNEKDGMLKNADLYSNRWNKTVSAISVWSWYVGCISCYRENTTTGTSNNCCRYFRVIC